MIINFQNKPIVLLEVFVLKNLVSHDYFYKFINVVLYKNTIRIIGSDMSLTDISADTLQLFYETEKLYIFQESRNKSNVSLEYYEKIL